MTYKEGEKLRKERWARHLARLVKRKEMMKKQIPILKAKGWSQKAIGEKFGISDSRVSQFVKEEMHLQWYQPRSEKRKCERYGCRKKVLWWPSDPRRFCSRKCSNSSHKKPGTELERKNEARRKRYRTDAAYRAARIADAKSYHKRMQHDPFYQIRKRVWQKRHDEKRRMGEMLTPLVPPPKFRTKAEQEKARALIKKAVSPEKLRNMTRV